MPCHTHTHRHTRLLTDYKRLGKSCSLQPCSYLKRSIAGKGTKAKPAINSHLPPCFSCPPAFMALPLLSLLPQAQSSQGRLIPGASSRALEAMWPSTDRWDRPGTLGLGGCGDTGPATCSQPCSMCPAQREGGPLGPGLLLQQNCKGWQLQEEGKGGSAKQQQRLPWVLPSQSGQPFPGLTPGLVPGPRVRNIGCPVRRPHGVEDWQ